MATEEEFVQKAKRVLDTAEKQLDAGAQARLRAARRSAIEEGRQKNTWARSGWLLPVGGLATAGIALAVAVLLWLPAPDGQLVSIGLADMEMLAGKESIDFFAELEFYEWLEHQANAGYWPGTNALVQVQPSATSADSHSGSGRAGSITKFL